MAWTAEVRPTARADLDSIYDFLVLTHLELGRSVKEAVSLAEARVGAIRQDVRRLPIAPHRGTRHRVGPREYRHLTIDRAVYWFTLDEASETVRVIGIFHGGQDHLDRMLARLAAEGRDG